MGLVAVTPTWGPGAPSRGRPDTASAAMKATKATYVVARARQAGQAADLTAGCRANYRSINELELPVVAVYCEVDEVNPGALGRARLDGGLTPEVSSCFSEDPAPSPPPRPAHGLASLRAGSRVATRTPTDTSPAKCRTSRAPLSLPVGETPFQPPDVPARVPVVPPEPVPGGSGVQGGASPLSGRSVRPDGDPIQYLHSKCLLVRGKCSCHFPLEI